MDSNFKHYTIFLKGLQLGKHRYEFPIDPFFLSQFELTKDFGGKGVAYVMLEKNNTELTVNIHISGNIQTVCDRCLDGIEFPVSAKSIVFVKIDNRRDNNDENIIWIGENEHKINIASNIYETLLLNLPIRFSHTEVGAQCNPEMVKILSDFEQKEKSIDPRWDTLKKIIKND